jgi:hypothetical protein
VSFAAAQKSNKSVCVYFWSHSARRFVRVWHSLSARVDERARVRASQAFLSRVVINEDLIYPGVPSVILVSAGLRAWWMQLKFWAFGPSEIHRLSTWECAPADLFWPPARVRCKRRLWCQNSDRTHLRDGTPFHAPPETFAHSHQIGRLLIACSLFIIQNLRTSRFHIMCEQFEMQPASH